MELSSSVRIDVPVFNGAAAGDQGVLQSTPASVSPDQYSSTPDHHYSSTTPSSGDSSLFAASPANQSGRPDPDSAGSTAAASHIAVTVPRQEDALAGERARALESLKKSIPHMMKLEQLQKSERQHQKEGSWHKRNVRRLSKELYVVVSWYALLQSGLFLAASQSTMFTCEDWWGPVLIAGLVTMGTLASALDKLRRMGEEQQHVRYFRDRQNAVYDNIAELYWRGSACNLDLLHPGHERASPLDPGLLCVLISPHGFLVLGFLVGFSALIIISCLRMLCHPLCNCSPH